MFRPLRASLGSFDNSPRPPRFVLQIRFFLMLLEWAPNSIIPNDDFFEVALRVKKIAPQKMWMAV